MQTAEAVWSRGGDPGGLILLFFVFLVLFEVSGRKASTLSFSTFLFLEVVCHVMHSLKVGLVVDVCNDATSLVSVLAAVCCYGERKTAVQSGV